MKKQILFLATALLLTVNTFAQTATKVPNGSRQQESPGISFTENKGQVHDQNYQPRPDVLYGAMTGNMAIHIKNTGVSYQLYKVDKYKEVEDPITKQKRKEVDEQTIYRIDLKWINVNKNFTKIEDETLPGYNNYYLESCPNGALNVKSYKGITLNNLYNGINLHYYQKNGELKHDYIVAPHSDYKQIQLLVEGAEISLNKDGSLILSTPLGKVQEGAPLVYQNGKQLKAKWVIGKTGAESGQSLSFEIENYAKNYELVIDPVTRLWGTYYGGAAGNNGIEYGQGTCTDLSGNVYLAGYTRSSSGTIIATVGSHQTAYGGGNGDAFLAKFDYFGVRKWGTYYGGSVGDEGRSCTCDGNGFVYLVGSTTSSSAIATPSCFQATLASSGATDGFIVKFNTNGVRQWGTYYGGGAYEQFFTCTTDLNNNLYVGGMTQSNTSTTIVTPGAHQTTFTASWTGSSNGLLVKFNSSGVRQWATFYGNSNDYIYSSATDMSGNLYIVGRTEATGTIIATPGSHQPNNIGSYTDGFLVKFNANGVRQWGTFYGGSVGNDEVRACSTDTLGNVYISGITNGGTGTVIATSGSHQSTIGGGGVDAFIAKFNSSGVRQWGTFYGGSLDDAFYSCVNDAMGNIYLLGVTTSTNLNVISTAGSHQSVFGGGSNNDAFLTKFNSSGVRQWGSYYGGTGNEEGNSIACDTLGNVYIAGSTTSSLGNVIATSGGHQSVYAGQIDAYLVKFDVCNQPPSYIGSINGPSVVCVSSLNSYTSPLTFGSNSFTWSLPQGWAGTSSNNTVSATSGLSGLVTLVASNACGVSPTQSLNVIVNPLPTVSVNSGTVCSGKPFTLVANGANTYTFSSGSVVSPTITSNYSVSGTSSFGCVSANPAISSVTAVALPTLVSPSGSICAGQAFTLTASGASTYSYSSGTVVSPIITSVYTISGTSTLACSNTVLATVSVSPLPTISVNSGAICVGQSFTLVANGATTYIYSGGQVVSPSVTSSYSVSGTSAVGCLSSNTAISTVTVSAIHPTITVNSGIICQGKSFTISPAGANTYTIQGGSSIVSPGTISIYTVAGTSTAGCLSSNTVASTVSVNPLPIVNVLSSSSLICEGESATLIASGASNYTYNPGGVGASLIVSPNVTSTYTITGSDANNCSNTVLITQSVDACLGIPQVAEALEAKFHIYPNPTNGILNLELNSEKEVVILNTLGQVVYSSKLNIGVHQLNLEVLAKGVYALRIISATGSQSIKLIKE